MLTHWSWQKPWLQSKTLNQWNSDLAADIIFVGGRHWKALVLLMIQTGMIGMVVLGGDR